MKRIMTALLLSMVLLFAGCSSDIFQGDTESKKQSRIEVYSVEDEKLIKTIDDQSIVNDLFSTDKWELKDKLPDGLVPEYQLLVYQEKTILLGQDPDEEREYELIATLVTFRDSSYVEEIISDDAVKNIIVPEYAMTFCYIMPDGVKEEFYKQLEQ